MQGSSSGVSFSHYSNAGLKIQNGRWLLENGSSICYPSGRLGDAYLPSIPLLYLIVAGIRFSPRPNRAHEINWRDWDQAAFELAQAEDKPVLLSISAVWCHWCHVMDETSYSDPDVINLINQHFIPVRVDSDQRPDINSRYNMGGWPTAAFLTPYGDVIAGATYMPPRQLEAALVQVADGYRGRKQDLVRQAQGLRDRRGATVTVASAGGELDDSIVDGVVKSVIDAYDPQHGGFGSQPKFPMVDAVELLLHKYRSTVDTGYREMVENTLDHMMKGGMYDHQEEGFFRYSTTSDWSVPHVEKMLGDNVGLLRIYLRSYLVTANEAYGGVASSIADYLNGHLYDAASGAFFGSQDADEEYYALPLARRGQRSSPEVDRVFYSDKNAAVAGAYLEASWVLNRTQLADMAIGTLEFLLGSCAGGPLCHSYFPEGRAGIPGLLEDYACLITALVDGYGHTFQARYLEEANRLAGEMMEAFTDPQGGGFFDIPKDPKAIGSLKLRNKAIGGNAMAAEALTRLYHVSFKEEYRMAAETALRAYVPVYSEYGEAAAGYALAVHRFLHPPVEVTVVGEAGSPGVKAFLTAAATIPHPNTAINFIAAGDQERLAAAGYWPGDDAQAYVCMDTVCLAPISDPQALHQTVEEFLNSRTQGIGSIFQDIGTER